MRRGEAGLLIEVSLSCPITLKGKELLLVRGVCSGLPVCWGGMDVQKACIVFLSAGPGETDGCVEAVAAVVVVVDLISKWKESL